MSDFAAHWPDLIERVTYIWPETERKDLTDIGPDREAFAAYLSEKHDLTRAEAEEGIDMWLLMSGPGGSTELMAAE